MNKITYLDGVRLYYALVAGANNVIAHQKYLNKINVFPVPDGDTGTNMAFTLTHILDAIEKTIYRDIDKMFACIADAALDGARGNSGVILAQFFQGLSDGSAGIIKMTTKDFSKASQMGYEYARTALAEPKDGTILTILKDFSTTLIELTNSHTYDFKNLLEKVIKKTESSLLNTPNLLPILKKSNVVDAGAQGFVDLLNGIYDFVLNGNLKYLEINIDNQIINTKLNNIKNNLQNAKFQYCTECIIKGKNINHKKIHESLQENGDSLVIAGSKQKTKIHIHVNDPKRVFNMCTSFGIVSDEKIDDMWQQQKIINEPKNNVAIVTDSGADIPENCNLDIHIIPVKYNFGKTSYIDKLSHTPKEFYQELAKNPIHPQTSQPAPGDFRRRYQYLKSHYNSIISIHIPHKVSGTFQSALNAANRLDNTNITVIDGLSASVGLGLIIMKVANLLKQGLSHNEIESSTLEIIHTTMFFIIVNDLSYVVKGGRLPYWVKIIADFFNIKLIMTTKNDGSMGFAGFIRGNASLTKKMYKFIHNKIDSNKMYNVSIGHSNILEDAKKLRGMIEKKYQNLNSIHIVDIGCALGVHTGPGALAIALQPV
tara:strand:- start:1789 stop:3582 length:1794 start_codon:yes stop_codon:yes gene_type:complete